MARARAARVYTPPPETQAYRPAPADDHDSGGSRQWLVLTIMTIVLAAGGYVLWTLYGAGDQRGAPVIEAQHAGGFKQRYDGPPVDELATAEIDRALEGKSAPAAAPAPSQAADEDAGPQAEVSAAASAPAKVTPPHAAGSGGFLVQIAALRAEAAADAAWQRLSHRDPALFAGAKKDVQRADLGGKGIYYRLRAGYFADRAEAGRFCDRVKTLGQECIVVVR